MFDHWYAMDIGGHTCRFYDFSKETECRIRSLVAWGDPDPVAVGSDAYAYIGQDQRKVAVRYPINHDQVISSFEPIISRGLEQLHASRSFFHPRALVVVPTDIHEQNLEMWRQEILNAGINRIDFVNVMELLQRSDSTLIIHSGHTYTELGIYAHDQAFVQQTLFFAGKQIDEEIQRMVAKKTRCLISEEDAGALKEAASNALWENKNVTLQCSAVNQYNQWTQIQLRTLDIWPCMMNVINQIVLWAKQCLQQVDVDMKEKIYQNGILLSGGLANCFGLRQTLEEELNQKVICSEHPEMDLMEALKGWR